MRRPARFFQNRPGPGATALLALLAAGLVPATADLVVVQKMSGDMQNGTVTLKFKGSRVRTDLGSQVSSIADGASGETFTLMHAKRTFTRSRLDPESLRSRLPKDPQAATAEGKPSKPESSGQRERLGEQECEIYSVTRGKVSGRYWVAASHPMKDKVRAALEPVSVSGTLPGASLGLPSPLDFPGLVLRTELHFEKVKAVLEFVSAREETLPSQLFEVPKDYREAPAGGNP